MIEDWTIDPETHRSNSGPEFLRLVDAVDRLIRESAHDLISGRTKTVAGLIMAQLAHKHGMAIDPERVAAIAEPFGGELSEEYQQWRGM